MGSLSSVVQNIYIHIVLDRYTRILIRRLIDTLTLYINVKQGNHVLCWVWSLLSTELLLSRYFIIPIKFY